MVLFLFRAFLVYCRSFWWKLNKSFFAFYGEACLRNFLFVYVYIGLFFKRAGIIQDKILYHYKIIMVMCRKKFLAFKTMKFKGMAA